MSKRPEVITQPVTLSNYLVVQAHGVAVHVSLDDSPAPYKQKRAAQRLSVADDLHMASMRMVRYVAEAIVAKSIAWKTSEEPEAKLFREYVDVMERAGCPSFYASSVFPSAIQKGIEQLAKVNG